MHVRIGAALCSAATCTVRAVRSSFGALLAVAALGPIERVTDGSETVAQTLRTFVHQQNTPFSVHA